MKIKKKTKKDAKIIRILKKVKGIITDSHIVLTSGRHTDRYINPDALLSHPQEVSQVAKIFADKFINKNIDVVAAPAVGGIVLSTWVAYHLSKLKKKNILGIFTEKTLDKSQIFERGFKKLVKGKNVLVIEDVTATGGSVKKVVDSVKKAGGKVIDVCVMINRDPQKITSELIEAPFSWLGVVQADSYEEANCPLCKTNVPINTEIGHGKEFLEKKNILKN